MPKSETGTARAILSDEEVLARRDRNAFDGGFQAGIDCGKELRDELLEALKAVGSCLAVMGIVLPIHETMLASSAIAKAEGK